LVKISQSYSQKYTATCFYGSLCISMGMQVSMINMNVNLEGCILWNVHNTRLSVHCWKAYEICYKTHMTIPTSP